MIKKNEFEILLQSAGATDEEKKEWHSIFDVCAEFQIYIQTKLDISEEASEALVSIFIEQNKGDLQKEYEVIPLDCSGDALLMALVTPGVKIMRKFCEKYEYPKVDAFVEAFTKMLILQTRVKMESSL